ncbi:MAG: lamin tail domain-containing protein, partial [Planctomycetota bacterium]
YAIDQFYRDSQVELSGYGSRGAFVHLYINGIYWGLYNPSERTDHWFTSEYFGGEPEHWFAIHHGSKSKPGFHGDSTRYQTLMNDLVRRDLSDAETYALVCEYIDTANFCDYMLCTWWMGVGDWPGNNWYAGCRTDGSPLGPTPLRFFAWDGEWSWDASRAGGPGYVHPDFRNGKSGGSSPIPQIWHALRRNDDFMMLFADRVYGHFFNDGPLCEPVAQQRWLRINEQLRSAVVAESARWGDAMENQGHPTRTRNEDWQREVDAIYNMIEGNSRQFLDHLRQQGYYPAIDPPVFTQRGGAVSDDDALLLLNPNASGTAYYTVDGSDPRSGAAPVDVTHITLFDEDAPKGVLVPTASVTPDWRGLRDFDDSQWTHGHGGVGYERSSGYESYIQIDAEAAMYQQQASCYIRIPFHFAGGSDPIDDLTLAVRYDDGFVAYLNGAEVARANMTGTPTWRSSATSSHGDGDAKVLERFSLRAAIEHLRDGDNILAIHGLNSSADSSDFLISAELQARSTAAAPSDGVAPGVEVANGPIHLPHSCTVKTRVRDGVTWSALDEATFAVGPVVESLRVCEIMYHPASTGSIDDPNTEFIELTNIGSESINLNLVQFTDGVTFTFPAYNLDPGARVLVVKDNSAFTAKYGAGLPVAGPYRGSLSNGGERILLVDAAGQTILDFTYDDGWHRTTDGQGHSLEVKDAAAADLNEKNAWQASPDTGGTPGM